MYYVLQQKHLLSSLFFCLATSTRSNGFVNVGFLYYFEFTLMIHKLVHEKNDITKNILTMLNFVAKIILFTLIVAAPLMIFSLYGYNKFCTNDIKERIWCNSTVPMIYSHVQTKYWELGFLKYYKVQKIPNILLAIPCVILIYLPSYEYIKINILPVKYLELQPIKCRYCTKYKMVNDYTKCTIFVFICHALFLLHFGLFFMHVEVITRMMMSSSPFIYWFVASRYLCELKVKQLVFDFKYIQNLSLFLKCYLFYCFSYCVIGTFLHVNFLPWT